MPRKSMTVTTVSRNGRTAGLYLKFARNVAGNAQAQHIIAKLNADYILPLRDAVIAKGKPTNDPMVVSLNTAHYRSSDTIDMGGALSHKAALEVSGDDVLAAVDWLEAQP